LVGGRKSLVFHDNAMHPKTRWTVSLATGTRSSAPYVGDSGSGATSPSPDVIDPGGGGSWACNVPAIWQRQSPWGGYHMQTSGNTISEFGCALTSATMVLDYHGATKNPSTMNTCMGPYADSFTWSQAITRGCDNGHAAWSDATDFYGYFDCNVLHDRLYAGQPVIIKMTGGSAGSSHFVVAMNWGLYTCPSPQNNADMANYISINDPRDGTTKTLSDYTNSGASLVGMRVYRPRSGAWPGCHF
jgi:hypothetical protein